MFLATYWPPGQQHSELCQQQRAILAQVMRAHGLPYVMFGDWSQEPEELQAEHHVWLEHIKGQVAAPAVAQTCSTGAGRVLDYAVCSERLRWILTLEVDLASPWSPHLGIHAALQVDPVNNKHLVLEKLPMLREPAFQ